MSPARRRAKAATAGRKGRAARRVTRGPAPALKARARAVLQRLAEAYPGADCALDHRNPFELLVATILSAQCTDERVNQVTPELFARWPTPAALARADLAEVEAVVRPTGFFRNKARHLVGMAQGLEARHGGQVPRAMADLLALPGVARKTANVVRGVAYGLAEGVVVDTHVARLSRRLGWTRHADPARIERDLMALIEPGAWIDVAHRLIHHGRAVCAARRPRCVQCPVRDLCPSAEAAPAGRAG